MRFVLLRLAALLTFAFASTPALAWWDYGHRTVARIAWIEVSPHTRAEMSRLMAQSRLLETPECPAANVADLSVWPDCIKRYRDRFSYAYSWHFADVDICRPFDLRAACRDHDCVTDQIERNLRLIRDHRGPVRERLMALAFLVHFVGDLHPPLHASDHDDRGGNAVRVYLGRQRTNLHHVWDVDVVQTLGYDARDVAASITVSPAQRKAWCNGNAADWANESHALARDIYEGTRGHRNLRLSPTTLHSVAPITRQQLAKAGTRLACTLNQVLG